MPEVVFEPRSTTIKRTSCLTYPLDHGFLFHICSPNDVTLIQGITILHPLCLSKYKNILARSKRGRFDASYKLQERIKDKWVLESTIQKWNMKTRFLSTKTDQN